MTFMNFTKNEQQAVLQCIWQFFGGTAQMQVVKEHKEVIDEITSDWILNRDWLLIAIEMAPYEAFEIVKKFPDNKKIKFKEIIMKLIEFESGDINYKVGMARSLFDATIVPYSLRRGDFLTAAIMGSTSFLESGHYVIM